MSGIRNYIVSANSYIYMGVGQEMIVMVRKGKDCDNCDIIRLWWKKILWCKCIVHRRECSWDEITGWRASNRWFTKWWKVWMFWQWGYTHTWMKHLENELRIYSRQNFIITILSVAKFIYESDIGGQPVSHYPGSNVDDQSTFHRGSMNFEILSSVILILCHS